MSISDSPRDEQACGDRSKCMSSGSRSLCGHRDRFLAVHSCKRSARRGRDTSVVEGAEVSCRAHLRSVSARAAVHGPTRLRSRSSTRTRCASGWVSTASTAKSGQRGRRRRGLRPPRRRAHRRVDRPAAHVRASFGRLGRSGREMLALPKSLIIKMHGQWLASLAEMCPRVDLPLPKAKARHDRQQKFPPRRLSLNPRSGFRNAYCRGRRHRFKGSRRPRHRSS